MSSSTTSCGEEKKDDSIISLSPDAVAKRLRDKIRLQAESLLSRCDTVESSILAASRSRDASRQASRDPSLSRSSSRASLAAVDTTAAAATVTTAVVEGATPPTAIISGTDTPNSSNRPNSTSSSSELTKRLQKLAMDRQNSTLHNSNTERLRVIQSDDNNNNHNSHLRSVKTFAELNLPEHLLSALYQMGFDRPSAIQEEALPRILAGRNIIGQAQSGSGKTAAFTIGMLYRIDTAVPTTQALCVTPTRELAIQILEKAVRPMSANMLLPVPLRVQLAVSQSEKPGSHSSSPGATNSSGSSSSVVPHLVVGTPGKIVDWLKRKIISAAFVKVFVLDEADTMVAAGSGHRANSLLIKKQLPSEKSCQCLFFSATFSEPVVQFASKMMQNSADKILIADGPEFLVLDVIKQLWVDTRNYQGGKLEFLADIYSLLTIGQSIVFVGRKDEADAVHATLHQAGYTCSVLHGAVEPATRDAVMEAFRKGESNVLITTNVLARGVDVDNVCLVVNYDIPVTKDDLPDYETYLHRIGRTGRFGRKGTAINLIADQRSIDVLAAIERHFSKSDGNEMIQQAAADPEALADLIEI